MLTIYSGTLKKKKKIFYLLTDIFVINQLTHVRYWHEQQRLFAQINEENLETLHHQERTTTCYRKYLHLTN